MSSEPLIRESVIGWAVITDGKIDVATVSPERLGAIVNWLVTKGGVGMVFATTTDAEIEDLWGRKRNRSLCSTVKIGAP